MNSFDVPAQPLWLSYLSMMRLDIVYLPCYKEEVGARNVPHTPASTSYPSMVMHGPKRWSKRHG